MKHCLATTALCLLLTAGTASAEGWTIKDLGSVATEAGCVDLGYDAFDRYRSRRSVGDLQRTEWVVYAYDITDDAYDAVITCSFGPNDTTRATLAVYASDAGDEEERRSIADRVERYWEQMK